MPRVALLLLALAALGCDSTGIDTPVADVVLTVADGAFVLETEDDYPCLGYTIEVDADVDARAVEIEILGVRDPGGDACLTALGPATASVAQPESGMAQNYTITLRKDGATDRYRYACGILECSLSVDGTPTFSRFGPR